LDFEILHTVVNNVCVQTHARMHSCTLIHIINFVLAHYWEKCYSMKNGRIEDWVKTRRKLLLVDWTTNKETGCYYEEAAQSQATPRRIDRWQMWAGLMDLP